MYICGMLGALSLKSDVERDYGTQLRDKWIRLPAQTVGVIPHYVYRDMPLAYWVGCFVNRVTQISTSA